MNTKLLINGKLVAGKGEKEDVLDPATGEAARVDRRSVAGADRKRRGRRGEGLSCVERHRAEGSRRAAAEDRRAHRSRSGRLRAAGIAELRQAVRRGAERRDPGHRRRVPFLRGRCAHAARRGRRRIPAGLHQHDPPRSGRRGRVDRAVELPADDGGVEAVAGARGRQHGRAEAVRADAAHGAQARDAARRAVPAGRRQHRARQRSDGRRGADFAAAGRDGLAHRRCVDGREGAAGGREGREAHAPGARRQGAGDRVRRRRSRARW